jgi:hypothetical protein
MPRAPERGVARRTSWLAAFLCSCVVLAFAPPEARAQDLQRAVRFQISEVADTTFTFEVGKASWVRAGAHGIAIDPRRRDALVAKFEVLRVDRGRATALITGETMRLTLEHFAVLEEPRTPWFAQRPFWLGAVLGALVGVGFGAR